MLNSVNLMGRLTNEPDYRTTQNGTPVVRFTLAIDRDYSGGDGQQRETDFVDIVAWRSTADFVSRYFRKGQLVAVQGSLRTGSYVDRNNVKRRKWEVLTSHVYFAESRQTVEARANNAGFSSTSPYNGGYNNTANGGGTTYNAATYGTAANNNSYSGTYDNYSFSDYAPPSVDIDGESDGDDLPF